MSDQRRLNVGVVGCGWHGKALAEAVVRGEGLRLVACVDPDEAAASRAALLAPDAITFASIGSLLAESDVDAVIVATPHHLLAPVTLQALRAGKHVMVEKPAAMSEREVADVEQVATRAGLCLMPGYSMRFSMGRHVRDLIDAGVVGDIRSASGAFCIPPMNNGWMARPETGGGPLLYLGSHLVDMALWFLADEPVEVFAQTSVRGDTCADDTSAFQVRLAKGASVQCLVTQAASAFSFEITIHGTAGKVSLRGRNFLQFEIDVSSNAVAAYGEPTVIRPAVRGDNISMMLVPELDEFVAAIKGNRPPSVAAVDARRVLRVLDGVIKSSRSHQPVALSG